MTLKNVVLQRVLLTATAVGMVASTALSAFDGMAAGPGGAVVPPGSFFAIWGVVIMGCLRVAAMSWRSDGEAMVAVVGWPLIVAQAGFSVWLFVASATSGPATVAVFAAILAALLVGMARLRGVAGGRWTGLAAATIGLYAGWSSAAIWLNIVTTLPGRLGDSSAVQAGCLLGAAMTAAGVLWRLRPSLAYALAVGWAFLGVAIAASNADAWLPLAVAVIGLCVVMLLEVDVRRRRGVNPRARSATRGD